MPVALRTAMTRLVPEPSSRPDLARVLLATLLDLSRRRACVSSGVHVFRGRWGSKESRHAPRREAEAGLAGAAGYGDAGDASAQGRRAGAGGAGSGDASNDAREARGGLGGGRSLVLDQQLAGQVGVAGAVVAGQQPAEQQDVGHAPDCVWRGGGRGRAGAGTGGGAGKARRTAAHGSGPSRLRDCRRRRPDDTGAPPRVHSQGRP